MANAMSHAIKHASKCVNRHTTLILLRLSLRWEKGLYIREQGTSETVFLGKMNSFGAT